MYASPSKDIIILQQGKILIYRLLNAEITMDGHRPIVLTLPYNMMNIGKGYSLNNSTDMYIQLVLDTDGTIFAQDASGNRIGCKYVRGTIISVL